MVRGGVQGLKRLSDVPVILVAIALLIAAVRADVTVYERHVAPGYCVEPTGAPWWFFALRVALVLLAIALVVVVRPRVRGAPASAWLGVAIAVVASLGVSELVLRRLWRDDRDPTVRPDLPEAMPDPRLGWGFRPSQTRGVYAIDAHGDRARTAGDVVDPARTTLVVAGESIAFGEGLAWDDTFGARLGRALELQVVNVGVPAFSSAQAHARLLDALARLEHPTRVVIVFVPQQIRRNAGGRTPWRLLRLVTDEPYHSSTPLTVTRDLLVASAAAVRAHGGEVLFVVTNYGPTCRAPGSGEPWLVRELFEKAGLPFVRVELTAADVLSATDPHPSPQGARKIADAVLRSGCARAPHCGSPVTRDGPKSP